VSGSILSKIDVKNRFFYSLNANSKRAAFWRRLGCFCYVILIGAFFFIPVEL